MPSDSAAIVARTSAESAVPVPRQRQARSRVTNGGDMFLRQDGRSPEARRARDLLAEFLDPFDGNASPAVVRLARRAAQLTVELEVLGGLRTKGAVLDQDQVVRLSGAIDVLERKLAAATPKKPTVTGADALAQHLAKRAAERAAREGDDEDAKTEGAAE